MAARYWVGNNTDIWDNTAGTKWALTSGGTGGQAVPTSADTVFFTALSTTVMAQASSSCWSGTQFIVVGTGGRCTTSPDGITWTNQASFTTVFGSNTAFSVCWSGTQFVAIGTGGKCATSPDGITWTNQASFTTIFGSTTGVGYSVCWSGTQFVAIGTPGSGGKCATSPDGITWTNQPSFTTAIGVGLIGVSICWSGTQFVAVGGSGTCLTSPDGITWTNQASFTTVFGSGNTANSICWSGTQFVAVGGGGGTGKCATSPDGITWTNQASFTTAIPASNGNSICWTGTKFVAVGGSGKCATSPDGITWTNQASFTTSFGNTADAYAVCWSGTQLLGVGYSGKYVTSSDGITWNVVDSRVTIGITAQASTLTMTGYTGILAFGTNKIQLSGTGTVFTGATTYSVTGTPVIDVIGGGSVAKTITADAVSEANSISFNITSGTFALTLTTASAVRSLDFTGFTGTWAPATTTATFYGSLTLVSGMTFTTGTGVWTWGNTSGTRVITSATKILNPITFNGIGGTFQLAGATTTTGTVTLTNGTLNLSNNTLTCTIFSSTGVNARSIAFGTGSITVTGTGTVVSMANATGFTYTGTPNVYISNATATATTVTLGTTGGTETNALNYYFTGGGTYTLTLSGVLKSADFSAFSGTLANAARTVYGDFLISGAMTITAGTGVTTFASTSTTIPQQFYTSSLLLDFPITKTGAGTLQVLDTINLGITRTLTLTTGTLDISDKQISVGLFSSSGTGVRSILFGSSGLGIVVNGSGNAWTTTTATNLTYSFTGPAPQILINNSTTTATTISTGAIVEAQALDYATAVDAAYILTVTGSIGNLDLTAFSLGTLANSARTIYRTFSLNNTTILTGGTAVTTLAPSTLQYLYNSGQIFNFPITKTGVGTLALSEALILTPARTLTLTQGFIQTNGFLISTGLFSSTNTNVRGFEFINDGIGTPARIDITGLGGTVWTTATSTNFSWTIAPSVEIHIQNNTATATTVSAGTLIESQALSFIFDGAGSFPLTLSAGNYKTLDFSTFTGTLNNVARTLYGSLILDGLMTLTAGTNAQTFAATIDIQQIYARGLTLDFPITKSGTTELDLMDGLILGTTRTFTFTSGQLFIQDDQVLKPGLFSSSNTNVRDLVWGTNAYIEITGLGGTVFNTAILTNFTFYSNSINPLVIINNPSAIATTVTAGIGTEAQVLNFTFPSGTYVLTLTAGSFGTLDFTGFSGTLSNLARTVYRDLYLSPTMTLSAGTNVLTFGNAIGSSLLVSNTKVMDFPITKIGAGTLVIGDPVVMGATRTFTLTEGYLEFNGTTLTTNTFSSSNTNTRGISGTISQQIILTGSGTSFNVTIPTGFTISTLDGSIPLIELFNNTATATTFTYIPDSTSYIVSLLVSSGTYSLTLNTLDIHSIDFTGFSGTYNNPTIQLWGNLVLSPTMTMTPTTNTIYLLSDTGQTITSNTKTITCNLSKIGSGDLQILDNMVVSTTKVFNLVSGLIQVFGDLTINSLTLLSFGTSPSISFPSGTNTLTLTGTGVIWDLGGYIGFGTAPLFIILSDNTTSSRTFNAGDLNYNSLIIGGNTSISTTEISGSAISYFTDISSTKTVAHTISLTGTITAQTWSINGTLGNILTLKSGTSGIPAELYSQNSIDLNYTSIYDISALAVPTTTPIFTALLSNGNINGGGNTGWIFGGGGGGNTSKFFLMF